MLLTTYMKFHNAVFPNKHRFLDIPEYQCSNAGNKREKYQMTTRKRAAERRLSAKNSSQSSGMQNVYLHLEKKLLYVALYTFACNQSSEALQRLKNFDNNCQPAKHGQLRLWKKNSVSNLGKKWVWKYSKVKSKGTFWAHQSAQVPMQCNQKDLTFCAKYLSTSQKMSDEAVSEHQAGSLQNTNFKWQQLSVLNKITKILFHRYSNVAPHHGTSMQKLEVN